MTDQQHSDKGRMSPLRSCLLAFCVLAPIQIASVVRDEWFRLPAKPIGDGMDYECLGFQLAAGRGFILDTADEKWRSIYREYPSLYAEQLGQPPRQLPATGRPPLFPTVVAGLYRLFGREATGLGSVRIFSALCLALAGALAAATTTLLFEWRHRARGAARGLALAHAAAWLATVVLAGSQRTLASYARDFLTEPLALLLTQGFVTVLLLAHLRATEAETLAGSRQVANQSPGWWAGPVRLAVLAGALLGGMVLCRSIFVFWLPAVLLLTLGSYPTRLAERWRFGLVVVVVAACCCLPWWIRNCLVLNGFQPLGTQGPITLLGGYSDAALAAGGEWQAEPERELRRELRSSAELQSVSDLEFEMAMAKIAKVRVLNWLGQHVRDVPHMMLARVVTHWNPYTGRSLVWKLAALIGVAFVWRYPPGCFAWLVGPLALSTVTVALLYSVGGRFLVPLYGILFILPGLAVGEITLHLVNGRSPRTTG